MNSQKYKKILLIISILLIGYHIFLYSLSDHETIWNNLVGLTTAVTYLIGSWYGFRNVKKIGSDSFVGKSILALSWGALMYGIASIIWAYYVFAGLDPYPSLADVAFLPYYPLAIIGTLMLLKVYKTKFNLKTNISLFLLLALSYWISESFLGLPVFDNSSPWSSAFDVSYTLGNFFIISVAVITLYIAGGKIMKGLLILSFSFLTQAIGDFYFLTKIEAGTWWDGSMGDVFFSLSGILLSYGIIQVVEDFRSRKQVPQQNHPDMEPQLSDPTPRAF